MVKVGLVAVILGACGNSSSSPDAAQGSSLVHTYFLNFDGVTLEPGESYAVANSTGLVTAETVVPSYLAADPDRATEIAAILAEVRTILAPYGVVFTTTRPTAATYGEIVITDADKTITKCNDCSTSELVAECNVTAAPVVGILFGEQGTVVPAHQQSAQIISLVGLDAAIPSSTTTNDCMCYLDPCTQQDPHVACTIGGAGTPVNAQPICSFTGTTMDEGVMFMTAFGPS